MPFNNTLLKSYWQTVRRKSIVSAGESLQFSASEFGAITSTDEESAAWTQGVLSFSDKPLGEMIATLSRYRNGVLRCDPAVAGLRLSGTFPLKILMPS